MTGGRYDVAIVGSGAAGSVMALELTRKGLDVVVVEQGRHEDPATFEHRETAMLPRLYKGGGLQPTTDHDGMILQGSTVGGSTVINNAIWMRPPHLERVLKDWSRRGADIPQAALESAYTEIEGALNVHTIAEQDANAGTEVFLEGCRKEGIQAYRLQNNRDGCIGCGWCNFGCKYGRKTSMLVTYLPWAIERGAQLLAECKDTRIVHDGRRATGVSFTKDHRRQTVDADKVVVCAGAIGSSALLLHSGITVGGRVGHGLHVLGGAFVSGEMPEPVNGIRGIGLTCVAEADPEYVIESFFAPPVTFAIRVSGWFMSHFERAERYDSFVDGGVMVGTDPRNGRVSLDRKGNVRIDLTFDDTDLHRLRRGIATLSRIYLSGGAIRVFPASYEYLEYTRHEQLESIERDITRADDLLLGSAHPQGGNPMHRDPERGVVDEGFRVKGIRGLYVADTSVWPSNIWANCQATAMATAHYAATKVAA